MRLPTILLLPFIVGAVHAASEKGKVYLFTNPEQETELSATPTLTPEEARLVIAHRLGISQYHSIDQVPSGTVAYINAFGRHFVETQHVTGNQLALLANDEDGDGKVQLVVIVDGMTKSTEQRLSTIYGSNAYGPRQPAFEISNPPSRAANLQFVKDMSAQKRSAPSDISCNEGQNVQIPPIDRCWGGHTKIVHWSANHGNDASDHILRMTTALLESVKHWDMDVMMILIPESSYNSKSSYGSYDMPASSLQARNAQIEEPIESIENSISAVPHPNMGSPPKALKTPAHGLYEWCYESNDTCNEQTRNCSDHGACYLKYKSKEKIGSCYTCGCVASVNITEASERKTYWGGAACQKQDISSPFWLLASFSVIIVGVVSAAIGMMFSVGEEKLPGVIGAGVSGPKAR